MHTIKLVMLGFRLLLGDPGTQMLKQAKSLTPQFDPVSQCLVAA